MSYLAETPTNVSFIYWVDVIEISIEKISQTLSFRKFSFINTRNLCVCVCV